MKKDYSFLNKVIILDNRGQTRDRYTIFFQDGDVVFANANCNHPSHGIYLRHGTKFMPEIIDFSGSDGDATHTTDKDDIKAINEANKNIGSYLTINAMKRLSKELLGQIEQEVEIIEAIAMAERDWEEYQLSGKAENLFSGNEAIVTPFENWCREQYAYTDRQVNIVKQYSNYMNN